LANLDALRQFTHQYEEACNRLHSAATLGGLLLYFETLAREEKDLQGRPDTDAVQLVTYHASKGLEWPMVIAFDLDAKLKDDPFGLTPVTDGENFNPDRPLEGRLLRFWLNPYASQYKDTALEERLETHAARIDASRRAREEEARLLYVGLTRPRDYLVLVTRDKLNSSWFNRVYLGDEKQQALMPEEAVCPWLWPKDALIRKENRIAQYSRDLPTEPIGTTTADEVISYIQDRRGAQSFKPILLSDAEIQPDGPGFRIGAVVQYSPDLLAENDLALWLAFTGADRSNYTEQQRQQLWQELSTRFEAPEATPGALLQRAAAFRRNCELRCPDAKIQAQVLMQGWHKGRRYERLADLVLRNQSGCWIVIQESHQPDSNKRHQRTQEQAMRLLPIRHLKNYPDIKGVLLHWPQLGELRELLL
jgi:hypothetical protein